MTDNIELPPLPPHDEVRPYITGTRGNPDLYSAHQVRLLLADRARRVPAPIEVSRWRSVAVDGLPPCDGKTVYLGENINGFLCTFNWVNPDGCCLQGLGDALTAQFSGLEWWTEAPTRAALPASTLVGEPLREFLGKLVRAEWMVWAVEQPSPKPSWLTPWDELTEPEREVDRRIGERLWNFSHVRDGANLSPVGEPAGFWLAPMEPESTICSAGRSVLVRGADGERVCLDTNEMAEAFIAARDSWLARSKPQED